MIRNSAINLGADVPGCAEDNGLPMGSPHSRDGLDQNVTFVEDKVMRCDLHSFQDRQSLLMHQKAVELLLADPSLVYSALGILARWDAMVSHHSKPLRDEWRKIIENRDWDAAVADSERGRQLRQASPLSILLPNESRLEIIRLIRKEKRAAHAQERT